jgi:hypothetical protein
LKVAAKDPNASERIFQSQVEQIATMNGWLIHHISPHQVRPGVWRSDSTGFPDLCLAHRDRGVIFAELKLENGKLSTGQVIWANALKPHVEHYVWRPSQLEMIAERLGRK